ncbi:MAG: hypothetical protein OHK0017_08610 [Patescibacteria group bacterium]
MAADQIKATLKSVSGGTYAFEIQECGLPEAKICKQGTKMNLSLSTRMGSKLQVGSMYLVSADFEEIPGGINFNLIKSIQAI